MFSCTQFVFRANEPENQAHQVPFIWERYLSIGVFPVRDVQDEYRLLSRVYCVEYAVVADSVTENGTQLAFQPFDIGPEEGTGPQCRINIVPDSGIISLICPGNNLLLKSLRLGNLEIIR